MAMYINVLKRLEEEFKEADTQTVLRTTEDEEDLPTDILTVLLEDYSEKGNEWLAEICFLPLQNGAECVLYLSTAITIAEDMTEDESNAVAWFISRFNHYAPFGAFSISGDGETISYKLCTPVIDNGKEDDIYESLSLVASHALDFVDNFGPVIEAIIDGDIAPLDAIEQFVGTGNE